MLEKIGLPAKPSQRGNNWVVDASHCQGCSSQFTFINRKHHCRRCGGLFCNSCTQHRMVLRGQGDSPVRICEPCKKLEEAARFEMRYGHRNRAGRGHSKLTSKYEDEILSQILGSDGDSSSGQRLSADMASTIQKASSSVSSLSTGEAANLNVGADSLKSPLVEPDHTHAEMGSISPEELRQRAMDEKKMYRILKGEGKSGEALKAFKRGKELERQADALEVSIKKNRRKALISRNMADIQSKDGPQESGGKVTTLAQVGKGKNDLISELRELGWSDADLHEQDKKSANMSLEGELSSLLGCISEGTKKDLGSSGIDKTQVVAHKRKALSLKREGKLAEAKEELKKSKILEKQLEEQEFLGADEDSDDEIAALMRIMDSDKHEELLARYEHEHEHDFELGQVVVPMDELGFDNDLEVTDEDLMDPEMADTLKSLGWTDESDTLNDVVTHLVPIDRVALLDDILALKRGAVNQKRAGHLAEAMAQLKKAKLLERDLEGLGSVADNLVNPNSMIANKDSTSQTVKSKDNIDLKHPPKSRLMIQKELLALKKKALALRREGKLDEAEVELKKGKVLEQQLEEMDTLSKVKSKHIDCKDPTLAYEHSENLPVGEEREVDVTEKDLHDPAYLSLLKDLDWKDEDNQLTHSSLKPAKDNAIHSMQSTEPSVSKVTSNIPVKIPRRSKPEIQRELLGLKRKALTLRREGKTDEAEELLRMAKPLEAQITEMDAPKREIQFESHDIEDETKTPFKIAPGEGDIEDVTEKDMQDPALLLMLKHLGWKDENLQPLVSQGQQPKQVSVSSAPDDLSGIPLTSSMPALRPRSKREIQRELLDLKRKVLALRRRGETEEAEELLKMGKALEAQMEELDNSSTALPLRSSDSLILAPFPLNGDNHSISAELGHSDEMGSLGNTASNQGTGFIPSPQQSLNAMDLPPGNTQSSSLMPAETLDNQRNTGFDVHGASLAYPPENFRNKVGKDNFDPDLSHQTDPQVHGAALTSPLTNHSGEENLATKKREPVVSDKKPHSYEANSAYGFTSQNNQNSLGQEVLAHKRKAVALKREGKLAEAREELRQAKLLEKSLEDSIAQPEAGKQDVSMPLSNAPTIRQKEASTSNSPPKPLSGRDRFKLQQESLSHKRQALKLRREGRIVEADAEFELAKTLEAQLEQLISQDSTNPSVHEAEPVDVVVEDFLDPQLLSALKAIGIGDADTVLQGPERAGPVKVNSVKGENVSREQVSREQIQLEEEIRLEKVKALNLKRSGKQAEALDALRRAKMLEKKLNSLAPR